MPDLFITQSRHARNGVYLFILSDKNTTFAKVFHGLGNKFAMARILAIDYGKKRVGIAVSDSLQIIAGGLATVPSGELFKFLQDYFAKENVETIVVGLPRDMKYNPSGSMQYIEPVVKGLKRRFPDKKVEYFDERFTSVLAQMAILESGVKKKERQNNKGLVDEISATIILRDYMESKRNTIS